MKPTSAGILICHNNKYLVVRATNYNHYGIPKGGVEKDETELEAAIRETREEVGIHLDPAVDVIKEFIRYSTSKKNMVVFIHHAPVQYGDLCCDTYLKDGTPEIDQFLWVTRVEALNMIKNHMRRIFEAIEVYT